MSGERPDQRVHVLDLHTVKPRRKHPGQVRHDSSQFDLACSGTMVSVNVSPPGSDVAAGAVEDGPHRLAWRGAVRRPVGAALPRGGVDVDAVVPKVRPIVDAVAERGAEAALEYGEEFDGVRPAGVRVPAEKLDGALADLDPSVRTALEVAIERARAVHADQRRADTTTARARCHGDRTLGAGGAGRPLRARRQRRLPVERGDERGARAGRRGRLLVIASPAGAGGGRWAGLPHPTILAAARLLGVDEVWAVGGAQAVALLAYGGTDTDGVELAPVDMITGPGNIYVTAAKRICPLAGRHRRRGRAHRDRDPGRPHRRPRACGRRPDQPGRARRDGRQRARHRQRRAWPTPPTANSRLSWRPPCTGSG